MTGTDPPSLFEMAAAQLRTLGIVLTPLPGEYRVNFKDGSDDTAYVTDDLIDAIEHGHALAGRRDFPVLIEAAAAEGRRAWRQRRRSMSAKAMRRRAILAHNHRMRARALKKRGSR